MALLPKSLVRRLHKQGINVTRWAAARPVSLDDYRELQRELDAKAARVEWQSGGIRMLHEQAAVLQARLDTLAASVKADPETLKLAKRVTILEAEKVLADLADDDRTGLGRQ